MNFIKELNSELQKITPKKINDFEIEGFVTNQDIFGECLYMELSAKDSMSLQIHRICKRKILIHEYLESEDYQDMIKREGINEFIEMIIEIIKFCNERMEIDENEPDQSRRDIDEVQHGQDEG